MLDVESIGAGIAKALLLSLKSDTGKLRALATSEAESLAHAIARIGGLLAQGQVDHEEAAALIRIQKNASEAVLASIAEVSRVAAHRAIGLGLKEIIGLIDRTIGGSLLAELL